MHEARFAVVLAGHLVVMDDDDDGPVLPTAHSCRESTDADHGGGLLPGRSLERPVSFLHHSVPKRHPSARLLSCLYAR